MQLRVKVRLIFCRNSYSHKYVVFSSRLFCDLTKLDFVPSPVRLLLLEPIWKDVIDLEMKMTYWKADFGTGNSRYTTVITVKEI